MYPKRSKHASLKNFGLVLLHNTSDDQLKKKKTKEWMVPQ
jgi:hypothetical protein